MLPDTDPDDVDEDIVQELTHSYNTGTQQQPHEAADLTQQTQRPKRHLLRHHLIRHVSVEDVNLQEVLPEKKDRIFIIQIKDFKTVKTAFNVNIIR